MKKIFLYIFIVLSLITTIEAKKNDYMEKIVKLWSLKTNGILEFNTTKTKDGYNLVILSKDPNYKDLFNKKPVKIVVDEGPIITKPHFTLGSAGLVSKGSIFDILNPQLVDNARKKLKTLPQYNYEATVSFSNDYESKFEIEPLIIDDKTIKFELSKITSISSYNLDSFTGKESINIDKIILKPKKTPNRKVDDEILSLSKIKFTSNATQEPIDDIMLFIKSDFKVDDVTLNTKDRSGKRVYTKFSFEFKGDSIRVDRELLDLNMQYNFKALDEKTIALAKGVKESKLILNFKNLGISGVVEFIKLSQKMKEINNRLLEASKKGDDVEIQKAIIESQEIANEIIPIWNKTFLTNKSEVLLDLELLSDKTSYIKLDFIYKGKPLSGNLQSAMLSLMAQQITLFDGKFDIAVDSNLATSINPFALMGLDLLKAKGFVDVKNGIYYLKGELKSGKIIIKGKAYTLPELTKALF